MNRRKLTSCTCHFPLFKRVFSSCFNLFLPVSKVTPFTMFPRQNQSILKEPFMELKRSQIPANSNQSTHPTRICRVERLASILACLPVLAVAASPQNSSYKSTFTFPNALPGKAIEVDKVYDPVAGTFRLTSNSSYIQSGDDLVKLERQEEAFLYKKYGA